MQVKIENSSLKSKKNSHFSWMKNTEISDAEAIVNQAFAETR